MKQGSRGRKSNTAIQASEAETLQRVSSARDSNLSLLDKLPALIRRAGTDAKCDWFNESWLQFTGRTMEEELGDGWSTDVHPDDRDRCFETYLHAFKERRPFELHYRLRRHDGEYRWIVDIGKPFNETDGHFAGYLGFCYDITHYKGAEHALRESEEKFRALAETVPEIIFTNRPDGSCDFVNHRLYECTGLPLGSGEGFGWAAALHPDDAKRSEARWLESVRTGMPYEDRYRFRSPDGTYRWFMARSRPITNSGGQIVKWFGVSTNIDDLTRAEEALRKSEERLDFALAATSEGVWDWDLTSGRVLFSPRWLESLGYSPGDLEPHVRSWERLVHPDDLPRVNDALTAHLEGRTPVYTCENRLLAKSGTYRWNLDKGKVVARDANGKPLRMVGTGTDITDRKQAEESLRAAKAFAESIVANVPEVIYSRLGEDHRVTYISPKCELLYGYRAEDFQNDGKLWRKVICPEDQHILEPLLEKIHRGEAYTVDYRIIQKQGDIRWVQDSGIPVLDPNGKLVRIDGIVSDLTERKGIEEALAAAKSFIESIITNVPEVIYSTKGEDLEVIFVSPKCETLTGYTVEEFKKDRNLWAKVIHPDDASVATQLLERVRKGLPFSAEYRFVQKNGTTRWVQNSGIPVLDSDGKLLRVDGSATDITDRKQAESDLKESELRYRLLVENSPYCIHGIDRDGKFISMNRAGLNMVGVKSETDIIGMAYVEAVCQRDRERVRQLLDLAAQGIPSDFEFTSVNGRDLQSSLVPIVDPDGKAARIIGITADITERTRAEQLQHFQTTVLKGIAEGFSQTEILNSLCRTVEQIVPHAICYILLMKAEGQYLQMGAGPSVSQELTAALDGLVPGGSVGSCGTAAYLKEAVIVTDTTTDPRWASLRDVARKFRIGACWSFPILSEGKKVLGTLGISHLSPRAPDAFHLSLLWTASHLAGIAIQRRQAEEALRGSEERFRQFAETVNEVFWMHELQSRRAIYVNSAFERVWGHSVQSLYEHPQLWVESIHPDDQLRVQEAFEHWDLEESDARLDLDYRIIRPDGQVRWIQDRGVKILNDQRRTCRFAGVATDITERKEVEEALREREQQLLRVLDDRETMSQNLHDGVLQSLYAAGLGLETCKRLLRENPREAVDQMNQVIAQLNSVLRDVRHFIGNLESQVIREGDLQATLQSLVSRLGRTQSMQIKLSIDPSAAARLTRDEAEHIGYIVQEALSNSVRHGSAHTGEISLGWRNDRVYLDFRDDGIGFDPETVRGRGRGLSNMASRAQKLGGQLQISCEAGQGTRISLFLNQTAKRTGGSSQESASSASTTSSRCETGKANP